MEDDASAECSAEAYMKGKSCSSVDVLISAPKKVVYYESQRGEEKTKQRLHRRSPQQIRMSSLAGLASLFKP